MPFRHLISCPLAVKLPEYFKEDEKKFKKLGFDRVYPPEADLDVAIEDLKRDLEAKNKIYPGKA